MHCPILPFAFSRPGLGLGACLVITPRAVGKKEVELVMMDMSMT